jgi:hypothetical protein
VTAARHTCLLCLNSVCMSSAADDDGKPVTSRKLIAWNYCTSWFLIDFLSSIPLDLFVGSSSSTALRLLKARPLRVPNGVYCLPSRRHLRVPCHACQP